MQAQTIAFLVHYVRKGITEKYMYIARKESTERNHITLRHKQSHS